MAPEIPGATHDFDNRKHIDKETWLMNNTSRRALWVVVAPVSLGFVLAACGGNATSQSETVTSSAGATASTGAAATTETVSVGAFDAISVSDSIVVKVTVAAGAEQSVEVSTPAGFNGKVNASVSGSTLTLEETSETNVTNGSPTVTISVPGLTSISAADAAEVTATGEVDSYQVTGSDSAQLSLGDFKASTVQVTLSDATQATVFASSSVTGKADGSADLTVLGSPATLSVTSSDAASVTRG